MNGPARFSRALRGVAAIAVGFAAGWALDRAGAPPLASGAVAGLAWFGVRLLLG